MIGVKPWSRVGKVNVKQTYTFHAVAESQYTYSVLVDGQSAVSFTLLFSWSYMSALVCKTLKNVVL